MKNLITYMQKMIFFCNMKKYVIVSNKMDQIANSVIFQESKN